MSDPFDAHHPLPRATVWAAGVLVLLTIGAAAFTRQTGIGAQAPEDVRLVAQRLLRFEDRPGGVTVLDAESGRALATLQPGADGFVRATLRSFARDRRSRGIDDGPPFLLGVRADGRLLLEDRATQRQIALEAFGPDNVAAFARFLAPAPR
jgi:putative photosynthetic complex assembly protein